MTAIYADPDLPRLLGRQLEHEPAERRWQRQFSPQLTYGRHSGPARSDARAAAVAIVLYQVDSEWHVPLTVRPAALRTHGGQVSFPGGALEGGESTRGAAHRELVEELFADRKTAEIHVDWIGPLAPVFVYVSNRMVHPWVGVLLDPPNWRPEPAEVERVLTLPVQHLVEDPLLDDITIHRGSLAFTAPRFVADGDDVWGTTAVLLGELRGRLLRLAGQEHAA